MIDTLIDQMTRLLIKRGEDIDQYQFIKLTEKELRIILNGQKYSISLDDNVDINSDEWKKLKTTHINNLITMRKKQHPSTKHRYRKNVLNRLNPVVTVSTQIK